MIALRSILASAASGIGPDDLARSDAMVRDAWQRHGLVAIRVDDPVLTWPERELLRSLAERRWGRRAR